MADETQKVLISIPSVTLDDFITSEGKRLLSFASAWRNSNADKAEKFPMSFHSKASWLRQYLAFSAHQIEKEIKDAVEKASKAA